MWYMKPSLEETAQNIQGRNANRYPHSAERAGLNPG
jgi:hypothetical protein